MYNFVKITSPNGKTSTVVPFRGLDDFSSIVNSVPREAITTVQLSLNTAYEDMGAIAQADWWFKCRTDRSWFQSDYTPSSVTLNDFVLEYYDYEVYDVKQKLIAIKLRWEK